MNFNVVMISYFSLINGFKIDSVKFLYLDHLWYLMSQ